jgi:hypothetical protein
MTFYNLSSHHLATPVINLTWLVVLSVNKSGELFSIDALIYAMLFRTALLLERHITRKVANGRRISVIHA